LNPCGKFVDLLSSCYRKRVRLYSDSDATEEVRWYFCEEDAEPLGFPSCLLPSVWYEDRKWNPSLGEQGEGLRVWDNGYNGSHLPGTCSIGTKDQFVSGISSGLPPLHYPDCCTPRPNVVGNIPAAPVVAGNMGYAVVGAIAARAVPSAHFAPVWILPAGHLPAVEVLAGQVGTPVGLAGHLPAVEVLAGQVGTPVGLAGHLPAVEVLAGQVGTPVGLAGHLPAVEVLAGQVGTPVGLAGHLPAVEVLAGQVGTPVGLAGELPAVEVLAGGLSAVAVVAGHLPAVEVLAGQVGTPVGLAGHLPAVEVLAGGLSAVAVVAGHLPAVEVLAGGLSAVAVVAGHLPAVEVLAGGLSAVAVVAGHLPAVEVLAGGLSAVAVVAGHLPAVEVLAGRFAGLAIVRGSIPVNLTTSATVSALGIMPSNLPAGEVLAASMHGVDPAPTPGADCDHAGAMTLGTRYTFHADGTSQWFKFPVTSGSTYFVKKWWNDFSGSGGTNVFDGTCAGLNYRTTVYPATNPNCASFTAGATGFAYIQGAADGPGSYDLQAGSGACPP
jgi:hypothetical protein